jgi:pimeloyl-ACP methyl ester carboxylesterase
MAAAGPALVIVGGALRSAEDYRPLAAALADRFTVHVLERRGRPGAPPQGDDYTVEADAEDLAALVADTGATRVFGHSFGGLVALEAARRQPAIAELALYEPGVSAGGSIPTGWLESYAQRLAAGDRRGAFALFVRGSGGAPAAVTRMPLAYLKLVLRLALRGDEWRRTDALQEASLREHREIQRLDGALDRYAGVGARILVLAGGRSSAHATAGARQLRTVGSVEFDTLPGLTHLAPDRDAPEAVATRLKAFYS